PGMDQSADQTEQTPAVRSRGVTAAMAVAALLAGGATGVFAIGPMLGPGDASAAPESGGGGGHGSPAVESQSLVWTLDGVIVNPAGSRGQNHLIATIAWKVTTAADEARLRGAEIELRDKVGSLLELNTLEQLTAAGARDRLRAELAQVVGGYLVDGGAEVFLPQFIVQ
ncbi:MAG TPA: flagellar basal body-associated FliL family protein, partial [Gemmatimonadales bacterium]|nr:flagellar basal body-associated FliL family protein [Gemmatimonadales bacterium]